MACKMLLFDYRDIEKPFFKKFDNKNFDIKFFEESLNIDTINRLSQDDLNETSIISVFITSKVCRDVISKFKNLRVISTRSSRYDHIDINACIDNNIALVNVETYENRPIEYILQNSFKGIISVYCGGKDRRIV